MIRSAAIERLKAAKVAGAAGLVDAAYSAGAARAQVSCATLVDPEPWQAPVELQSLLTELVGKLNRFVALKSAQLVAIALWIIHTHCLDAAEFTPRLAIVSPTKRCGKTTLVKVLQNLVRRPLSAANISGAALFRVVEQEHPTLLIDEADTFLDGKEELRGVLNTGHDREGGKIIRCKSAEHDHEVTTFNAWGAVAIAQIAKLPATLADRSITIELKRKTVGESVGRFRRSEARQLKDVQRRCARWAQDNVSKLTLVPPVDVPALDARAADNWEPLFAIAEIAGVEWAARAIAAAEQLSTQARATERENDPGERLLNDIRGLCLEGRVPERVALKELSRMLVQIEDAPWARIDSGRPLDSALLAKRLRTFDIVAKPLRLGPSAVSRGYARASFEEAFSRYLPAAPVTPVTPPEPDENLSTPRGASTARVTGNKEAETTNGFNAVTAVTDASVETGDHGGSGA